MKLVKLNETSWNVMENGSIIANVERVSKYDGSYEITSELSNKTAWALRKSDIIRWTKKILDRQ